MKFEMIKKFWIIPFLAAAVLILLFCMRPDTKPDEMEIHVFSIGKADAFLLHSSQGNVLIDTGEKTDSDTILKYLADKEIKTLDYMIITHFDKDHVGGAAKILKSIPVNNVIQSNCPKESQEYERFLKALGEKNIQPITITDVTGFEVGKMKFSVIGTGDKTFVLEESNNSSLITTVEYGSRRFLFMGDSKSERIQDFLNTGVAHYDFLQVPHHGEYDSLLKPLISHCSSGYAVITCSEALPEKEKTVKLLEENGAEVYLTRKGAITLTCDGEKLNIRYDQ